MTNLKLSSNLTADIRKEDFAKLQERLAGSQRLVEELTISLLERERELLQSQQKLHLIETSRSWKITAPMRHAVENLRRVRRFLTHLGRTARKLIIAREFHLLFPTKEVPTYFSYPSDPIYAAWIKKFEPRQPDYDRLRLEQFDYAPKISIVLPVYNPAEKFLKEALDSVLRQTYSNWELCVADDASTAAHVRTILLAYADKDPRIKLIFRNENGHISAASNSAFSLVTGEYTALLDHDDLLAPHAFTEIVRALQQNRNADIIYTNEDKIDGIGRRSEPAFKAAWSPDYFRSFMYIGHLTVYRTLLVQQIGGFRTGFEGSQDYDLALRIAELANAVIHVPLILYHWRKHEDSVAGNIEAKPYAFQAGKRALQEALDREKEDAFVEMADRPGQYRCRYKAPEDRFVSIFVYSKQGTDIQLALEKLKIRTAFELIDIVAGCIHPTRSELVTINSKQKVIFSPGFGDRAAFWTRALSCSIGEYVMLLDYDLSPVGENWLHEMLSQIARRDIGAVGPKLVMPDSSIVSAGYYPAANGVLHRFYGVIGSATGYGARLVTCHNVAALSSSGMLLKREGLIRALEDAPAFTTQAALDLAICHSIKASDQRLLWTPYASLQFERKRPSGKTILPHADIERLGARGIAIEDPFYPPWLDCERGDFSLTL